MTHNVGFIYAHPDDESFLSACLIRQLADQGEQPVLQLATKGDAGSKNGDVGHLTKEELAAVRVLEMEKAAQILGLTVVEHLGFPDGKLNMSDEKLLLEGVIQFINRYKLKVVISFPEDGGNFHPDHVAISRMTTAAVLSGRCPTVQKLYYCATEPLLGKGHQPSITLDTAPQWEMKADALRAHHSQIFAIHRYFGDLISCPENRRYEAFVLGWERGVMWPVKEEQSVVDNLL
ncbi:Mycothiol S-conjugate amidase [compost metagenome]